MNKSALYPLREKETPWKSIEKDEGVILKLKDGTYYTVDEIGLVIWELCDGKVSVEDMTEKISSEFNAEKTTVRRDISEFVTKLEKEGLLSLNTHPLTKDA